MLKIKYLSFFLMFTLLCFSPLSWALNILFINPAQKGQPNWDKAQELVAIAAQQLNIKVIYKRVNEKKRSALYPIFEALEDKSTPIDAVIFMASSGDDNALLFSTLEQLQLPFITLENSLDERDYKNLGYPREKFSYWLTQKGFNDHESGYKLALSLFKEAERMFPPPIELVALSGRHDEISALRNQGLLDALEETSEVKLNQITHTNWSQATSKAKTLKLLKRFPDTKIIWCASDSNALGAHQALVEMGLRPGIDVIIGGVDWQLDIFPLMLKGEYHVSAGGQVLAAASAIVYLYDYFNGVNKQLLANMPNIQVDLVTQHDPLLVHQLQQANWNNINFKKMSILTTSEAAFFPTGIKLLIKD
ncbi:ABC transporter substrate-binding protein [Agarivorans aestuarii]|uniref:ABC transporter substrate-binding protein n=1 Tax=Agarivorans aestuarii TaxID=1563703 RepID=UPI001C81CBB0|nr:ABC transporter substrate-binding protein [Agarivorans aestuarii]